MICTLNFQLNQKLGQLAVLAIVIFMSISAFGQKKVVGYIPTGYSTSSVDFTRITHLNIAFENADASGNLSWSAGNDAFVTAAHNNNVKVLVSICGGGASNDATYQARYASLMNSTNRSSFISKIVSYLNTHNLDGIDLDLEGAAINSSYSDFVIALDAALPVGKLLTAALSHDNGGDVPTPASIQTLDYLNIMAYDFGWGQPVHHSTFSYATTCINWWMTNKGLPASKVVLGVPFYGYTNTTGNGGISFAQILSTYGTAAAQQDTWVANGNTIYYNGIPTIRQKTQLVVDNNYGGVMIWQLAQDATGTNSLLYNIDQVIKLACTAPAQPGNISGATSVPSGSSQTYSIAAVSGATSYTWTLPSGWTGSSTSTSITTTVGTTGGTISVKANNACGSSATRTLSVTIGTSSPNLALNKSVTVSSVEPGTTFNGALAVDGNATTRWSSNYVDPSWIYVNLGGSYNVNRVKITWEAAYATAYQIQVSNDAANWTTIKTVTGNATTVNDWTGLSGTGNYVRIYGTARNSQWGYSIFELEVYGTSGCTVPAQPGAITGNTTVNSGSSQTYSIGAVSGATSYTWTLPSGWSGSSTSTSISATAGSSGGTISVKANNACGSGTARTLSVTVNSTNTNLALNKAVVASSVEPGTTFNAALAVDGNATTRWSSNYVDPSWIYVNLGATYNVNRVKITWEAAYATSYLVQVSADAINWTTMKTVTGNASTVNDWTGLSGSGKYVRIYGTARNTQWGYSIFELEVYGTATGGRSISLEQYEEVNEEILEIYPTEVDGTLHMKYDGRLRGGLLNIHGMSGQELMHGTLEQDDIDVSGFPTGFYVLRVSKEGMIVTRKFMRK